MRSSPVPDGTADPYGASRRSSAMSKTELSVWSDPPWRPAPRGREGPARTSRTRPARSPRGPRARRRTRRRRGGGRGHDRSAHPWSGARRAVPRPGSDRPSLRSRLVDSSSRMSGLPRRRATLAVVPDHETLLRVPGRTALPCVRAVSVGPRPVSGMRARPHRVTGPNGRVTRRRPATVPRDLATAGRGGRAVRRRAGLSPRWRPRRRPRDPAPGPSSRPSSPRSSAADPRSDSSAPSERVVGRGDDVERGVGDDVTVVGSARVDGVGDVVLRGRDVGVVALGGPAGAGRAASAATDDGDATRAPPASGSSASTTPVLTVGLTASAVPVPSPVSGTGVCSAGTSGMSGSATPVRSASRPRAIPTPPTATAPITAATAGSDDKDDSPRRVRDEGAARASMRAISSARARMCRDGRGRCRAGSSSSTTASTAGRPGAARSAIAGTSGTAGAARSTGGGPGPFPGGRPAGRRSGRRPGRGARPCSARASAARRPARGPRAPGLASRCTSRPRPRVVPDDVTRCARGHHTLSTGQRARCDRPGADDPLRGRPGDAPGMCRGCPDDPLQWAHVEPSRGAGTRARPRSGRRVAVVVATYSIVVTVFGATLSTDVGTRRRWGRRFADRRPGAPGAGGAARMRRTDHQCSHALGCD